MLDEKMKAVLEHAKKRYGVENQSAFALRVGFSADRLRNILGGKIKKLQPDEARTIESAFGIRRAWWTSDSAPMLLTDAEMRVLAPVNELASARDTAVELGLTDWYASTVEELLFNVRGKRTDAIRQQLDTLVGGGAPASDTNWSSYIQVPHYDVRASAGNGSVVHEENVVDHLVFKRDWVMRSMGLDPRRLALIDVRGDSMAPTINDGDLILLDTREGQQTTEGIYAINLAGGLLVKRIRLRLSGSVEVISDNERYGTETISGDQLGQLHIVGRVVWQGRKI